MVDMGFPIGPGMGGGFDDMEDDDLDTTMDDEDLGFPDSELGTDDEVPDDGFDNGFGGMF